MKAGQRVHECSFRLLLVALALTCPTASTFGHTTGLSTSDLNFRTNGLEVSTILAEADLILAVEQLGKADPFDKNRDGSLDANELASSLERLRQFASASLAIDFDGQPIRAGAPTLRLDDQNNFHIELFYGGARPARLRVRVNLFSNLPPAHLHFVAVHDADGKTLGEKMLKRSDDAFEVVCPATAALPTHARVSTFADFLKLGVEHIWTGYDHLLFLLGLLIVCKDFKSAVQVVTFFTIAHSITLAFATLKLVSVSSRVVEPAIAASIIYVGVENFTRKEGPKGRWLITFLFGLVHGFGFASVLRDLGVASSTTGIAMPLVSFNLGVEAGQIVIAAILLPVIWQLRKWEPFVKWGVPAISGLVAAIGAFWLVQRLFFA